MMTIQKKIFQKLNPFSFICEIIFILSGSCKVIYEGKEEYLTVGDCHYCKKGQSHAIINNGDEDLVMFAVVCAQ